MAFVTTQTNAISITGSMPPLLRVTGTYLSSGGDTGGVIAPGYTNSSGTFTAVSNSSGLTGIGGRTIVSYSLTPTLSDATAPGAAKSYNATLDTDVITIVTTADTGGVYTIDCLDNGA